MNTIHVNICEEYLTLISLEIVYELTSLPSESTWQHRMTSFLSVGAIKIDLLLLLFG